MRNQKTKGGSLKSNKKGLKESGKLWSIPIEERRKHKRECVMTDIELFIQGGPPIGGCLSVSVQAASVCTL